MTLLFISLLACGTHDEGGSTDTNVEASGTWQTWAEEQVAAFEASGTCPAEMPATVVDMDGVEHSSAGLGFAPGYLDFRRSQVGGQQYSLEFYLNSQQVGGSCDSHARDPYPPQVGEARFAFGWYREDILPTVPAMFYSDDSKNIKLSVIYGADESNQRAYSGDDAYAWLCLEEAGWPDTPGYTGPAPARGSFFVHVERWSEGEAASLPAPFDFFVTFDHADCGYAEEAAGTTCDDHGCYWAYDCDGLDNDLDGEVDEGADDCDANGVADCLERDPGDACAP